MVETQRNGLILLRWYLVRCFDCSPLHCCEDVELLNCCPVVSHYRPANLQLYFRLGLFRPFPSELRVL
jgi:hypothetical protein